MKKRRLYLYSDFDRHGNRRWYFSPPGWKKIRIKEAEGTKPFKARYLELFALWETGDAPDHDRTRVQPTDLEWLFKQYMASGTFKDLAEATRTQRRNFMNRTARVHGKRPFRSIGAPEIAAIRDSFGDRKGAARNFVKTMRAVFSWAASAEVNHLSENPIASVSLPHVRTEGHLRWTAEDVQAFLKHHQPGSKPRRAMTMLLCTGQRISDIRTLGRPNLVSGGAWLKIRQKKTGATVEIPMLQILRAEIEPVHKQLVWLLNSYGEPFSEKSLPQKFSKWARDAGVDKSAHGLRKSVGSILAELGASEDAIMAILGHSSSTEARIYIRDVNRRRLTGDAMNKLETEISHFWAGGKVGN